MSDAITPLVLQKYAAVYIDVPNVRRKGHFVRIGGGEEWVTRYSLREVDWENLVDMMLRSLETVEYRYVGGAYCSLDEKALFYERDLKLRECELQLKESLGVHRAFISAVARDEDVDSKIIIDLWSDVLALAQECERKGVSCPVEIHVLLASGDHIYGEAVNRIREAFKGIIAVRLHTFSWRSSLSAALVEASDVVKYLDPFPPLSALTRRDFGSDFN